VRGSKRPRRAPRARHAESRVPPSPAALTAAKEALGASDDNLAAVMECSRRQVIRYRTQASALERARAWRWRVVEEEVRARGAWDRFVVLLTEAHRSAAE
jgi:hypothetical protein